MTPEQSIKVKEAEIHYNWLIHAFGDEVATAWLNDELKSILGNQAPFIPKAHEQTK